MTKTEVRPLYIVAREIKADWKNVHYTAKPYLDAMVQMQNVNEAFGYDTGKGIVLRFLGNAQTWRGDTARRIKAELNSMVK